MKWNIKSVSDIAGIFYNNNNREREQNYKIKKIEKHYEAKKDLLKFLYLWK